MTYKSLPRHEESGINEAGRKVLPTPNGPDHNRSYHGGPKMAVDSQYNDSAHLRNPEQTTYKWKTIGELAAALEAKFEAEYLSKRQVNAPLQSDEVEF